MNDAQALQTRTQGGSFTLEEKTGALTLTERTEGMPTLAGANEVVAKDARDLSADAAVTASLLPVAPVVPLTVVGNDAVKIDKTTTSKAATANDGDNK